MRLPSIAVLAGTLVLGTAALPVVAQTPLVSARPSVALSVSDKTAVRQPPVAFTVAMPGGQTTTAVAQPLMGGERAGTVHYPGDFGNAGTRTGDYTWTARIGDKTVATGRFAYRPTERGQTLVVPD